MYSSYLRPAVPLQQTFTCHQDYETTRAECQYLIEHGEPMSYQHHYSTFLHLATHGMQSQ